MLRHDNIDMGDILKALERDGWNTMAKTTIKGEHFLWRMKDGQEQLAIVTYGWRYKYIFGLSDELWNEFSGDFKDIPRENVLFVVLGDRRIRSLLERNVIGINHMGGAVLGKVAEHFAGSKESLKKMADNKVHMDVAREYALYGGFGGTYSTVLLWIVMAFIAAISVAGLKDNSLIKTFASGTYFGADDKEAYRFLTYGFFHISYLHLASNLITMAFVGRAYIKRNGWYRFLVTLLIGSAFAGVTSYYYSAQTGINATVGISGGIFALLGGLLADSFINRDEIKWTRVLGYTVATFAISSINIIGTVDIACHAGGLIFGIWYNGISLAIKSIRDCKKAEKNFSMTEKEDLFEYSRECNEVASKVGKAINYPR